MKVPVSWLRQYVDVPADAAAVAGRLGACGFAVESVSGETIDFEITANRPDCLSVYGLAREAATAFERPLAAAPGSSTSLPSGAAPVKVTLESAACRRYVAAVADVTVGPSPAWLAARLTAAGVRPINAIVDVTNYVMLEMGQPMHAFDAARISGSEIRVRDAAKGECLQTLDGQNRTLEAGMLVIADHDRVLAVAGVMGGATSEVSATTSRIVLESAWFAPAQVRSTSRKLGLKTEASARFERGADPGATARAISRTLELLGELQAGRLSGDIADIDQTMTAPRVVHLRRDRIARLLGDRVPDGQVVRILSHLEFDLTAETDGWMVSVPTWRVDVSREADLIEEVGRHWGLDRIPATFPALRSVPRSSAPGITRGRLARRVLTGAGLQEAVTFTFIDASAAAPFAVDADRVTIANPLSEKFAVLRPSLVPGLMESLDYNLNRQAADVRLFEVGSVFAKASGERSCVGWVLTGTRGTHWSGADANLAFADAMGVAELVAAAFRVTLSAAPADNCPWLARGQRASLRAGSQTIGWVGQIAGRPHGDAPVFAGEIDLEVLAGAGDAAPSAIAPLPRYPSVVRDLSILVAASLPAADVRGTIRSNAPATLVAIREFDRYQGKGIPESQVSLSIRLTFQDPARTLTDAEVQQAVTAIVAALEREHHATLRGR